MMKKLNILSGQRLFDTSLVQVPTVISSENRVKEKGEWEVWSHLLLLQNAPQVKLMQST